MAAATISGSMLPLRSSLIALLCGLLRKSGRYYYGNVANIQAWRAAAAAAAIHDVAHNISDFSMRVCVLSSFLKKKNNNNNKTDLDDGRILLKLSLINPDHPHMIKKLQLHPDLLACFSECSISSFFSVWSVDLWPSASGRWTLVPETPGGESLVVPLFLLSGCQCDEGEVVVVGVDCQVLLAPLTVT